MKNEDSLRLLRLLDEILSVYKDECFINYTFNTETYLNSYNERFFSNINQIYSVYLTINLCDSNNPIKQKYKNLKIYNRILKHITICVNDKKSFQFHNKI